MAKVWNIPLTRGHFAVVDDIDYTELSKHTWHYTAHGYAARRLGPRPGKIIYMHRLICGEPKSQVDHINGNPLDNRRLNLREASMQQQRCNARKRSRKKKEIASSTFKGVTARKTRWIAQIRHNTKHYYLGMFDREDDAARAYDKAAIRLFGEFARPNFISK